MDISKKIHLIIYRFREKGLEVFLLNSTDNQWELPTESKEDLPGRTRFLDEDKLIELDPIAMEGGNKDEAWAIEGDWHEIPSLKAMLYEDAKSLGEKLDDLETGSYVRVKEAFKRVLPQQYKFLKELKDILIDRNSVKDL
jgi:hypothetical protein